MAHLTQIDRQAFRQFSRTGWKQSPEERSPVFLATTVEARQLYCRWAAEASKFFKGKKPVRFGGSQWKL